MDLKEAVKQFDKSPALILKGIYRVLRASWIISRMPFNGDRYRSEIFSSLKSKKHQYQVSTYTELNRYPELFEQCKLYLQSVPSPRLLSMGCSTGEEVETLGLYMSNAQIIGVDINKWCVSECRKKFSKNINYTFYTRGAKQFATLDNFDAIFCLAVLQRIENRRDKEKNIATGFTFDLFEQEIKLLDTMLKPGGLLIIDHCDFNFMDTIVANQYLPLDFEYNQTLQDRPLFDHNNKKIAEESFLNRIFVKKDQS